MKKIIYLLFTVYLTMISSCFYKQYTEEELNKLIGQKYTVLEEKFGEINDRLYKAGYEFNRTETAIEDSACYQYIGFDLKNRILVFKVDGVLIKPDNIIEYFYSNYTDAFKLEKIKGWSPEQVIKKYGRPISEGYLEYNPGGWIYRFEYKEKKHWNLNSFRFEVSGYDNVIIFNNEYKVINTYTLYSPAP